MTREAVDTMSTPLQIDNESAVRPGVVDAFCNYGLIGGLALGALAGVLYVGPHFHDWGLRDALLAMLAWSGGAGAIGWLSVFIAHGCTGGVGGIEGGYGYSDGHGSCGGGDGGGACGGGDGGCS